MDAITTAARDMLLGCCADLRATVTGLDADDLAWTPAPETSSLATLVRHATSATRFLAGAAASGEGDRVRYRAAERGPAFAGAPATAADLTALIDRLEAEIPTILAAMPEGRYGETVVFTPAEGDAPTRAWALLHTVEHLREHVGHAQLTRQVIDARRRA